jgi:hypothetical protein
VEPKGAAILSVCEQDGIRMMTVGQETGKNGSGRDPIHIQIRIDKDWFLRRQEFMEPGSRKIHRTEAMIIRWNGILNILYE